MSYLALREQESDDWRVQLDRIRADELHTFLALALPEADYHSIRDFISFHTLDPILDSPLECRYKLDNPPKRKPEWIEGSAIHQLLIFGNTNGWGLIPRGNDGRTKDGKATLAKLGELYGEQVASEEIFDLVEPYESHDSVAKIIVPNITGREWSIFWRDSELGLLRRQRTDIYCEPIATINDIKTTWTFEEEALLRLSKQYTRQLAYYREGLQALGFPVEHCTITWVKKTQPIDVAVWRIPDANLDAATEVNRKNLKLFKECLDSGRWPGRYPSIQEKGAL